MRLEVNENYATRSGGLVLIQEEKVHEKGPEYSLFSGVYSPLVAGKVSERGYWTPDGRYCTVKDSAIIIEVDHPFCIVAMCAAGLPPEMMGIVPENVRAATVAELESLVSDFNTRFAAWMKSTGCVANFGWQYAGKAPKALSIEGIDAQIYKKPLPGWAKQMDAVEGKLADLAK